MKVKQVIIGIKSLEQGLKEFAHVVKSIERGKPPKTKKDGVYFVSLEAMLRVLTPRRLELLHTIREKHPGSMYELARLSGRHLKNIQHDLGLLSRLGLVTLNRQTLARKKIVPTVNYDNLQLQIPLSNARAA